MAEEQTVPACARALRRAEGAQWRLTESAYGGANRNGEGHYETVTLVEHGSGAPLGSLDFRDEGAEAAAVFALLEEVSVEGRVVTLDALHTTGI